MCVRELEREFMQLCGGGILRVLSAVVSLFIQSATVSNWNEEILGWPMYTTFSIHPVNT